MIHVYFVATIYNFKKLRGIFFNKFLIIILIFFINNFKLFISDAKPIAFLKNLNINNGKKYKEEIKAYFYQRN